MADLSQIALLRLYGSADDGKRAVEKSIRQMFILVIEGIAAISAEREMTTKLRSASFRMCSCAS
jgi:hypothetical protein